MTCPGQIDFNPRSGFDSDDLDHCYKIQAHVTTSGAVDKKVRGRAESEHRKKDQPRYDCVGNNCHDYADNLANYARYLKVKERLAR